MEDSKIQKLILTEGKVGCRWECRLFYKVHVCVIKINKVYSLLYIFYFSIFLGQDQLKGVCGGLTFTYGLCHVYLCTHVDVDVVVVTAIYSRPVYSRKSFSSTHVT